MRTAWPVGLLMVAMGAAVQVQATTIHKCEDADGHIYYRDRACDEANASREIDQSTFNVSGRGGLTEREWREYERIRQERAAHVQARIESGRAQVGTAIGYEDRLRLRELRMRRKRVLKALDRDHISIGEGAVLRQELEEIGRQEDLIVGR